MTVAKSASIDLTAEQLLALNDLFQYASEQERIGRRGVIICQPFSALDVANPAGKAAFAFIEMERAKILMGLIALPPVVP